MDLRWLQKRGRGIHITIRDIDCKDFDAERMAQDFADMGVTFFSFFAGGYVTTYPSKLPYSRRSPWLGEQDITGAIVKAAHARGIKAIAMADLSILPPAVEKEHPEWAVTDSEGRPVVGASGMYAACIMGGYREEYGREMVREILERYDVDAVKFGGGSYTFADGICHCERCRRDFEESCRRPLPSRADWDDPAWVDYQEWRISKTTERCKYLFDLVKSIRPDMPVMGNGGCMGALDMESMSKYQDMIQLEGQTRILWDSEMNGRWVPPLWVAEEASYVTTVTDRPVWVVVSYWRSRPWRRAAVDYAEQKPYMAQILANGASPMVNLSGGPPIVHEDQRGFKASTELFCFLRDHAEYYDGDRSGANVAVLYSPETMVFYGRNDREGRYIEAFRGFERALTEEHLPFDVVSSRALNRSLLSHYRVLVLPNAASLSEKTADTLRQFAEAGGSIVATFETGLYDERGGRREVPAVADLLGADSSGIVASVTTGAENTEHSGVYQNYCILSTPHEITRSLEGTSVLPIGGAYCQAAPRAGALVPLVLGAPFPVFPEGLSYPTEGPLGHPMMIVHERAGGQRSVYLPNQLDKLHYVSGMPDIARLLADSVRWAAHDDIPLRCVGPTTLSATLRLQENRALVHLINFTGGERYAKQLVPLYDIGVHVGVRLLPGSGSVRATSLSDGKELPVHRDGAYYGATLPRLADYEVVFFRRERRGGEDPGYERQ